jgi:hypothetical protein
MGRPGTANTGEWSAAQTIGLGEIEEVDYGPFNGYAFVDGWVDTDSYMGWVHIDDYPWVDTSSLSRFAYVDDSGWMFILR